MKIFHCDKSGLLLSEGVADVSPLEPEILDELGDVIRPAVYLIPAGAVTVQPPAPVAGKVRRWSGGKWALEDEPAPAPVPPVPTEKEIRTAEIDMRLQGIDREAVRPLRAVLADLLAGKTPAAVAPFDKAKLATLETEAAKLRAERAAL